MVNNVRWGGVRKVLKERINLKGTHAHKAAGVRRNVQDEGAMSVRVLRDPVVPFHSKYRQLSPHCLIRRKFKSLRKNAAV